VFLKEPQHLGPASGSPGLCVRDWGAVTADQWIGQLVVGYPSFIGQRAGGLWVHVGFLSGVR
jgi:hypothetical protein